MDGNTVKAKLTDNQEKKIVGERLPGPLSAEWGCWAQGFLERGLSALSRRGH